jgi:Fe-S-cluster-containing hydrogenase component 2
MALRSACFLPFDVPTTAPMESVCDGCDAPCASACPGEAFDASGWRVDRCADFHMQSNVCIQSCASRNACPVGAESVYSSLQQRYHYNRELGRVELAQALEIEGDYRTGIGPLWGKI